MLYFVGSRRTTMSDFYYCRARPIRLTGSGAQCILGLTVVEFTKKASPVDGLPGPFNECRLL